MIISSLYVLDVWCRGGCSCHWARSLKSGAPRRCAAAGGRASQNGVNAINAGDDGTTYRPSMKVTVIKVA